MSPFHLLAMFVNRGIALVIGSTLTARAKQPSTARHMVAAGNGFGLVVDQATGAVWRCEAVDVACDKLRLE